MRIALYKKQFMKRINDVIKSSRIKLDYAIAHCIAEDVNMIAGIWIVLKKRFGEWKPCDARNRTPSVFYLVMKELSNSKPTYQMKITKKLQKLVIAKMGCGLVLDLGMRALKRRQCNIRTHTKQKCFSNFPAAC